MMKKDSQSRRVERLCLGLLLTGGKMVGCATPQEEVLFSGVEHTIEFIGNPHLQNAVGNPFELEMAYAVLYSLRYPSCPEETVSSKSWFSLENVISPVFAGHSDIAIPSNWNHPIVIDLLNPITIQHFHTFEPQTICEGMMTWARYDGGTLLPETLSDARAVSVYLQGTCVERVDGLDQQRRFEIETSVPAEAAWDVNYNHPDEIPANPILWSYARIDLEKILENLPCSQELVDKSSSNALKVLYSLQQSTTFQWEVHSGDAQ